MKRMEASKEHLHVLTTRNWEDYELLDSGDGSKLERYGPYVLVRPEAEAVWSRALPQSKWDRAHAVFQPSREETGGQWKVLREMDPRWAIGYKGLKVWLQTSASRHVGIFPEQAAQWDWIEEQVRSARHPLKVLNLFGYTGVASLAAARAGATVTHVDASKKIISWARENQDLSGLADRPVRWIVEDAIKFVRREARRGARYDGLILDPPKFGRGPKGEVWEFYKLLPMLLADCRPLMSRQARFIILTAYAVKASAITLRQALEEMMAEWGGQVAAGEVTLAEQGAGRLLSMAIYARWQTGER
jgi:23S rRNA (cytosine1962-C5)-methyltransferase